MKFLISMYLIVIVVICFVAFLETQSCNKPDSLAEKLNWNGQNCER